MRRRLRWSSVWLVPAIALVLAGWLVWKHYHDNVKMLRDRLAETERELMVARDHLMAIEVKLDILEGAANVLDRRTRITAPQDQHESSARA